MILFCGVHPCVKAGDQCWVPSSIVLYLIFLKKSLSLNAELSVVAGLAGQAPMNLLSPSPPELPKGKKKSAFCVDTGEGGMCVIRTKSSWLCS